MDISGASLKRFKWKSTIIHVSPSTSMTLALLFPLTISYSLSLLWEELLRYHLSPLDMWTLVFLCHANLIGLPVVNIPCFVTSEHLLLCPHFTRPLYYNISLFVSLYESLLDYLTYSE